MQDILTYVVLGATVAIIIILWVKRAKKSRRVDDCDRSSDCGGCTLKDYCKDKDNQSNCCP